MPEVSGIAAGGLPIISYGLETSND